MMAAGIAKLMMAGISREKEIGKRHHAFLPDQQRGDVTKRTERTTGIGGDHDIDTGQGNKARTSFTHSQNNRPHQQGGGQIVATGRNKERLKAGNPE